MSKAHAPILGRLTEDMSAGNWVYITGEGTPNIYKADATDVARLAFGVILEGGVTDDTVYVHSDGLIEYPGGGLTPYAIYYLSDTSAAMGTIPGTKNQVVGRAMSATMFRINIV